MTSSLDPYRGVSVPLAPDFGEHGEKRPRKPDFCSGWKTGRREGVAYDRSFSQHNAPRPAGRARIGRRPASGAGTTAARTVAVRATVPPSRYPPGGPPSCGAVPSWRGGYRPAPARGCGPGAAPAPGRAGLTGRPEWRLDACGPGRQASPPRRPASGPAATAPGNGEAAPSVTARDHPAPGPAAIPLRQGRAARPYPPRRAGRRRGLSCSAGRQPRAAVRRRPCGGRT
jgi:hypothetical protein